MSENIIYCYSGSGHCLDMAKSIARALGDTDIVLMRSFPAVTDTTGAKRVGFVFPCYGGGLPGDVEEYVKAMHLGQKEFRELTAAGKDPHPAALEALLPELSRCAVTELPGAFIRRTPCSLSPLAARLRLTPPSCPSSPRVCTTSSCSTSRKLLRTPRRPVSSRSDRAARPSASARLMARPSAWRLRAADASAAGLRRR